MRVRSWRVVLSDRGASGQLRERGDLTVLSRAGTDQRGRGSKGIVGRGGPEPSTNRPGAVTPDGATLPTSGSASPKRCRAEFGTGLRSTPHPCEDRSDHPNRWQVVPSRSVGHPLPGVGSLQGRQLRRGKPGRWQIHILELPVGAGFAVRVLLRSGAEELTGRGMLFSYRFGSSASAPAAREYAILRTACRARRARSGIREFPPGRRRLRGLL